MKKIILLLFSIANLLLYAVSPEKVVLFNTGKMNIAPSESGASIYVQNAVRCDSVSAIILNGVLKIGGNFIQDAETNVFPVGDDGNTTSSGTMVFTADNGVARFITTTDLENFDRSTQYIAFPNIVIETNDTIVLHSKMGIDALSIKKNDDNDGFILLESGLLNGNAVYDASLRITTMGDVSENLVDSGAVVVEQYMAAYRNGTQLFPFASPYKNTQLSGYFAGNWVRRMLRDDMRNTVYVLGNKPLAGNSAYISEDQYVIDAKETFEAGASYLIKPRPAGYDYESLKAGGGLAVTGAEASLYNREKFTFDGSVYTIAPYKEQLFAEDTLFSYTFDETTTLDSTLNWVIGNSYSAPISVDSLKEEMEKSTLLFVPYIYVFPPGSTTYQAIDLTQGELLFTEIPAKSLFILRISKNQPAIPAGTTFRIGKKHLHHGNYSNNFQKAKAKEQSGNRNIDFRVTLAENKNVYDLSSIVLRETASLTGDTYDIPKIYTSAEEGFLLYTRTPANTKLTTNGIPLDTDSVLLNFKPQADDMQYTLTVSQPGNEEQLWLKDLKLNTIINLQQTPYYTFTGTGTDSEGRFIVYFKEPKPAQSTSTSMVNTNSDIFVTYSDGRLTVCGLADVDVNSNVYVYDVLGRMTFSSTISQYPQQEFNINLQKNVYVVSIQGQRNFKVKTLISNR